MNKKFFSLAACALITLGAQAKVKLPHILGDNMVPLLPAISSHR